MKDGSRKQVIAGNWKMNLLPREAGLLTQALIPLVQGALCDVVLCVPYLNLPVVCEATRGTNLKVGAQNCHWEEHGAFTGEISAVMLRDIGAEYVIVGHSERRQFFGETDETVAKRLRAGLDAGLRVILCVGELLEQRSQGITLEVVRLQTKIALAGVSADELSRVIIAYEPVWAIGTGLTATPEQANLVNLGIRSLVSELYDSAISNALVIQYGGSMNRANAAELLAQPDIDGGLIGGASLSATDFSAIVAAANES